MAATLSPFFLAQTDYYGAPVPPSSIAVDPANYISTTHDAIDGVTSGDEQMLAFSQFFGDRLNIPVDAVADSGNAANMPISNPDRLSATFVFNNTGAANTWTLTVRWGRMDRPKKEYFLKRIMRFVTLQLRDGDNAKCIMRSVQGQFAWQTDGNNAVANVNFLPLVTLGFAVVGGGSSYQITFAGGTLGLTQIQMRAIFNNYILYRSRGIINPASLTWVTDALSGVNLQITLAVGTDQTQSITAMEMNDFVSTGIFSIFDRLAYEISTNKPDPASAKVVTGANVNTVAFA